ncbi:MAG: hypothetical protein ACTHJT_11965 [Cytophaga sp.]|uniref:hypothetical protein n=1 Tax=Cytophaga sp. TaxID=29535 RepID=UPI003F8075EB
MVRSLFILLLSGFSCLLFSSAVSVEPPPDPDVFSKLFVGTIKKNDKELFMKTFGFTEADVKWMVDTCLKNPYLTEKDKEDVREKSKDLTWFWTDQNERLTTSFNRIQTWTLSDSIQLDAIEFIDFYYNLGIQKEAPVYILHDTNLLIKHETKYYKIIFDIVIFINNQWKVGKVKKIVKVDPNQKSSFYSASFPFDIGIRSEEITYDTASAVIVADTLYADSVANYDWHTELPPLTEKQSKKANRIQKKIDALYLEQVKILYKEE